MSRALFSNDFPTPVPRFTSFLVYKLLNYKTVPNNENSLTFIIGCADIAGKVVVLVNFGDYKIIWALSLTCRSTSSIMLKHWALLCSTLVKEILLCIHVHFNSNYLEKWDPIAQFLSYNQLAP